MNNLRDFLAPFSHLLFANRIAVIIVLCVVLFVVAIQALLDRWRADRLEHDLAKARSSAGSSASGRRYSNAPAEEPPEAGSGALPPVKGGRTYARNLGSALQKAGMSQPIYSPPTPTGWNPNTSAGQGAPSQPAMTPPYATPQVPWATPQPPANAPWAFPAGSGRSGPGPTPAPAPFYAPQPPPPQPPAPMQPQTPATSAPAPGIYQPAPANSPAFPLASGPFGQPGFPPAASSGQPPALAPTFGPPAQPGPLMTPPGQQEMGEPGDGGRRGKPKRRRFNFNVLENLEKMVQAKPTEPPPATSWTPQVPAPGTSPTFGQAGPATPPITARPAVPAFPAAAEPAAKPAAPEASSLPLPFGEGPVQAPAAFMPDADSSESASDEPASDVEPSAPDATASDEPAASAPEPEPWRARDSKRDDGRSMRSMMFGEEASSKEAKAEEAPAPQPEAPAEPEQASEQPAWPSYSWSRADEASSSVESEPDSAEPQPSEASSETAAPEAEPVAESSGFDKEDWKSSQSRESDYGGATSEHEIGPPADASDTGHPDGAGSSDGDKPSAGTLVIIEDDATAATYYSTLFRGNGYQVEVANDGVSGVDLCARVQPQVILLDVMMPRQNGILVLQTLRASDETKNTPVVVMSNFSEPTLIKRALQLGALEYVIKTQVEGPALLNALPRWMNREKAFAAA